MKQKNPRQEALQLQKKIFGSLKKEADLLLGKLPDTIRRYERECRRDFKTADPLRSIAKAELIKAVQSVNVTFIADYHTFNQAQRTALRIIREAVPSNILSPNTRSNEWMLGLEMVPSQFQTTLDRFQAGEMTVLEFHEAISYLKNWGFPWKNYAPIFHWAKEHQVRIIALNGPPALLAAPISRRESDLDVRDQWAAAIITEALGGHTHLKSKEQESKKKMIVLYGDLHVGTAHLPKQLDAISKKSFKKPLSWITIHQNEDCLYWKLAEANSQSSVDSVELKPNVYCVFSSTPWAKLQSLVDWTEASQPVDDYEFEESNSESEDQDEDSENADSQETSKSESDYLSMLQNYGNTVAKFLELPQTSYTELNASSIDRGESLEASLTLANFSTLEMKLIHSHIAHNMRIFIPRICVAYLGSPSPNGAAELASIHLLKSSIHCERFFKADRDAFFRLILEFTFGFFGSLIFNPRRKCDLVTDHIQRLEALQHTRPTYPMEEKARYIAVAVIEDHFIQQPDLVKKIRSKRFACSTLIGSRYVGQILGKKLHQAVLSENVTTQTVREIFFKNAHTNSDICFESRYLELIGHLAEIPSAPSKKEVL